MKQVSKQVPVIVKIISILYYIGAVTSVIVGILLIVGGGMLGNYLENYGALFGGLAIVGGILMVVFGVVGFFIGRGLWKAKQWARIVVIILSALGVISAIVSLAQGATSSIVSLLISGAIGGYLWFAKEAKKTFA
jgi:drug/metabolite transporter (DMT)-like permease